MRLALNDCFSYLSLPSAKITSMDCYAWSSIGKFTDLLNTHILGTPGKLKAYVCFWVLFPRTEI